MKNLRSLFFTISLNASAIFFSFYSILGKSYSSMSEDSGYLIFVTLSIVFSSIFIIMDFARNINKTRQVHFFFYLLPFITLCIYLVVPPESDLGKRQLTLYLPFSVPLIYIGLNVLTS